MTCAPQSTRARIGRPAAILAVLLAGNSVLRAAPIAGGAQAPRVVVAATDLRKDPGGTPLVHLRDGTPVALHVRRGTSAQVTLEGWIYSGALQTDDRNGFDVSVSLPDGAPVRLQPAPRAPLLGMARTGALFDSLGANGAWIHVRRTGWVERGALQQPADPKAAKPSPKPQVPSATAAQHPATPPAPGGAPAAASSSVGLSAGAALSLVPGGTPIGTIESPAAVQLLERRGDWSHVQLDVWVRQASLSDSIAPDAITLADLHAAPDKYVGKTVEWTLQVLSVQKADELRPDLPYGQPYVLASGPLPESGFVYLVVTPAQADSFANLDPLAKVRVRATIRAARSRYLPTPILNYVRRLN